MTSVYPIAIYANGLFQDGYPNPPVAYTTQAAQLNAGITTPILWSIHIHANGDLYLNDSPFVSNGQILYSTDPTQGVNPDFPALMAALTGGGGSVAEVLVSVGAWGTTSDFSNWLGAQPAVQANLSALVSAFGVAGVDFDYESEDGYTAADQSMIVTLTLQVFAAGCYVTYCPYTAMDFWAGCLSAAYAGAGNVQPVKWMNLQCYAGGGGNDQILNQWIASVKGANAGVADPAAFIVPGFAVAGSESDGQTPSQLQQTFAGLSASGVTGGFLWNSGAIFSGEPGVGYTPADYAEAISQGLGGGTGAFAGAGRAASRDKPEARV